MNDALAVEIPKIHHEPIYCASCGKNTVSDNGKESVCVVDAELQLSITDDKIKAFYQKQLGAYSLNKKYVVCWECWLSSMGCKP